MNLVLTHMMFQEPESLGCLLELTWNGQNEIPVGNSTRKYLEDGDEVILTGCCKVLWIRLPWSTQIYLGLHGDAGLYLDSICWFLRVKATTLVLEPAPGRFCRHFPEPTPSSHQFSRVSTIKKSSFRYLASCYVTEQYGLFSCTVEDEETDTLLCNKIGSSFYTFSLSLLIFVLLNLYYITLQCPLTRNLEMSRGLWNREHIIERDCETESISLSVNVYMERNYTDTYTLLVE